MTNSNYTQGSRIEYKVVKLFQNWGYEARRTAGSHGPYDVIVIGDKEIYLIQCKKYKTKCPSYTKEVAPLVALPVPANVKKFLAVWQEGKGWDKWIDVVSNREISWRNPATQSLDKQPKKKV